MNYSAGMFSDKTELAEVRVVRGNGLVRNLAESTHGRFEEVAALCPCRS